MFCVPIAGRRAHDLARCLLRQTMANMTSTEFLTRPRRMADDVMKARSTQEGTHENTRNTGSPIDQGQRDGGCGVAESGFMVLSEPEQAAFAHSATAPQKFSRIQCQQAYIHRRPCAHSVLECLHSQSCGRFVSTHCVRYLFGCRPCQVLGHVISGDRCCMLIC